MRYLLLLKVTQSYLKVFKKYISSAGFSVDLCNSHFLIKPFRQAAGPTWVPGLLEVSPTMHSEYNMTMLHYICRCYVTTLLHYGLI